MLRLTLDIVPFGEESRTRHIGTLEIARTTPNANPETYNVRAYAQDGELMDQFQVRDHYYDDGAMRLACRAVECLVEPDLR